MSAFTDTEATPTAEVVTPQVSPSEALKNKGNDLYKQKLYSEAVAAYTEAIILDEENALLYNNRAAARIMMLQFREAADDCSRAVTLDPTLSRAYFRKATALKGLGRRSEALQALDAGLLLDPNATTAQTDKANLLRDEKRILEAQKYVEARRFSQALTQLEALVKDSGSVYADVNTLRVKCLLALKRPEEALNLSNSIMKNSAAASLELLVLRSQILFAMGEVEMSFKHLQQAMRSDPDNSTVRSFYRRVKEVDSNKNAGDAAIRTAKFLDAITAYTACLTAVDTVVNEVPELLPSSFLAKVYFNRSVAYGRLKKHKECVDSCTLALKYNPEYSKALKRRGESYVAMGGPENIELGISDYEEAKKCLGEDESDSDLKEKIHRAKIALKRSKRKDLYAILGVAQDASEAEIRSAYRKKALKYHPDKQASKPEAERLEAETLFKTMNEAYEVLSDPEKKEKYDSGVDVEDLDSETGGHEHFGGGGFPGGFSGFPGGFPGGGFPGGGRRGGGGFPAGFHPSMFEGGGFNF